MALPVKYSEPWQTVVWPMGVDRAERVAGEALYHRRARLSGVPRRGTNWLFFGPRSGLSGSIRYVKILGPFPS